MYCGGAVLGAETLAVNIGCKLPSHMDVVPNKQVPVLFQYRRR